MTAEPAAAKVPIELPPPRIQRVTIEDFRAFPKGHPGTFEFEGKNLLVYGENGAGKSSLFKALDGLFSLSPPDIVDERNVFNEGPVATSVAVEVSGEKVPLLWDSARHPTAAVEVVARSAGFLTYRELTQVYYQSDTPDFFGAAVKSLMADQVVRLASGSRTIGDLWAAARKAVELPPGTNWAKRTRATAKNAIDDLNDGMSQATDAVERLAIPLLAKLLRAANDDPLTLQGLYYTPAQVDEGRREITGAALEPSVAFHGSTLEACGEFLNEARLTALSLAIFLAGRKASVPSGAKHLKLLVLDDILVSLDRSHRRPVLNVIREEFADWQIVLLTHDRLWFNLVRQAVEEGKEWHCCEVHPAVDDKGQLQPIVRSESKSLEVQMLERAEIFVGHGYYPAAANYARAACELVLRKLCENRKVPVLFRLDGKQSFDDMYKAAKKWASVEPQKGPRTIAALAALQGHRQFVFNPLSHNHDQDVPKNEVVAAIAAVRDLAKVSKKEPPAANEGHA